MLIVFLFVKLLWGNQKV